MTIEAIARAVLYEGYTLYPYRLSSLKNARRILFGTLGGDTLSAATEVILTGETPVLSVSLRFIDVDGDSARETVIEGAQDFDRGTITVAMTAVRPGVHRARVSVRYTRGPEMGAAHFGLRVENGAFVSLIDPPPELVDVASACRQEGLFPVLVGAEMLASPIILYDHPKIAPESKGDLFDALEIEEILSLRVQTLTDAEKAELRRDPRTCALLDRVEALAPEDLARLHGAFRERGFVIGERVRLRPKTRADALDVLLGGMDATVVSVEQTLEGEDLVCVTIDRDPGKDLGERGFPGHRFFFRPDEMERRA